MDRRVIEKGRRERNSAGSINGMERAGIVKRKEVEGRRSEDGRKIARGGRCRDE
jgi:hypothetical protein